MNQVMIIQADTKEQYEIVGGLFEEYASSLGLDLAFQNFEAELKNLPGAYSAPDGCILLVKINGDFAGCVALRRFDNDACEMKRMYVKPKFQGNGIGKLLAETIVEKAKEKGYGKMRLDTVSSMEKAIKLYQTLGFKEIAPYRYNPSQDAKYFELNLEEQH